MRAVLLIYGLVVCLLSTTAAIDWRGHLLAAETSKEEPHAPLTQLLLALRLGDSHRCHKTDDCCDDDTICKCTADICVCSGNAYWQESSSACVAKGGLGQNCTIETQASRYTCLPEHSSCQNVEGKLLCECEYPYYPDKERQNCVLMQSAFFTTTIIVSICVLFAAVAIGVVMQVRSNMQRRLYRRHYRRHADLDAMLAAQRRARQRRAARRDPARRYSEEAAPDEPPPPYVPIFTTRSSGDWGKLPSYQEAVAGAPDRDNEAFEMEEGISTRPGVSSAGTEAVTSAGTDVSSAGTDVSSAGTEAVFAATSAVAAGSEPGTAGAEPGTSGSKPGTAGAEPGTAGAESLTARAEALASGTETAPASAEVVEPSVVEEEAVIVLQPHLADQRTTTESAFRRAGSL